MRVFAFFVVLLAPFAAIAEETVAPSWFSELGVGFFGGAALREVPTGETFEPGWALGPDIHVGVLRHGVHRLELRLGYRYPGPKTDAGTVQVAVESVRHRIDLGAGYDFNFKMLVFGAHLGTAMTVVRTHTVYREVSFVTTADTITFFAGEFIEDKFSTGVDFGFLAGTSVGFDFGYFIHERLGLELRIGGDYQRRGERDEFLVGGYLSAWIKRHGSNDSDTE